MIMYLNCTDNNKVQTIFKCFLTGVKDYGLPIRVRSDKGKENVAIADFMLRERGAGRGSMITGKSVHFLLFLVLPNNIFLKICTNSTSIKFRLISA